MLNIIIHLSTLFVFSLMPVWAEQNSSSQEALRKTQDVIRNPQKRNAVIQDDQKAMKAEEIVRQVMGENTDEIHHLSAEILEVIYKQADGDELKMQEIVNQASRNPAAFLQSLPEDYKNKVHSLADKSPLQKNQRP